MKQPHPPREVRNTGGEGELVLRADTSFVPTSAADLEERFPQRLLHHAALCVGLHYERDVSGQCVGPTYACLADVPADRLVAALEPFHSNADALTKLHHAITADDVKDIEIDESFVAEYLRTTRHNGPRASYQPSPERGQLSSDAVVRLHKMFRNPLHHVALNDIREAEIALRKYNAKQKEIGDSIRRVYGASVQLEMQETKYHHNRPSHQTGASPHPPHGAAPATGSQRPVSAPASVPRSDPSRARLSDGSSVALRSHADHVGKLLLHLKKHALTEREALVREVAIRSEQAATAKDTPSKRNSALHSATAATLAPSSSEQHHHSSNNSQSSPSLQLVSARVRRRAESAARAFERELEASRERERQRNERLLSEKNREEALEFQLSCTQDLAERRRYQFLRNRELRIRLHERRIHQVHADVTAAQVEAQQREERDHAAREAVTQEKRGERSDSQARATQERTSVVRMRQHQAALRAEALALEKQQRALEKEQAYRQRMSALDDSTARRVAATTTEQLSREAHRRSVLQKAKELEEKKRNDALELRQIMEDDLQRTVNRNKYLADLHAQEAKIKETQRVRLVHQYTNARKYRAEAFREQWDQNLDRARVEEEQRKAFAASLHDLHDRENNKLRKILAEQRFTPKDIEKLDKFILELDSLIDDRRE